jgi:hypothetical protein
MENSNIKILCSEMLEDASRDSTSMKLIAEIKGKCSYFLDKNDGKLSLIGETQDTEFLSEEIKNNDADILIDLLNRELNMY